MQNRIRQFIKRGYDGYRKGGFKIFSYYLIKQYFYLQSLLPTNYLKFKAILKKSGPKRIIIIAPIMMDWQRFLYQRFHQLAINLGKLNNYVFYCPADMSLDQIGGFSQKSQNVFVTNCHNMLINKNDNFIYWLNNVTFDSIDIVYLKKLRKKKKFVLVYDYVDLYHPAIFWNIAGLKELQQRHQFLLLNADIVLCSAKKLYQEAKKNRNGKTYYVPNGCDFNHFNIRDPKPPGEIKNLTQKPIVGYFGAIARWLDFDLINWIVGKRKDLNFLFLGPDYDGSIKKLKKIKNFFYLGPKNYAVLPRYGTWFDVAIIPFKKGPIANATSPVKLYEYFALGKSVVSIKMEEVRQFEKLVLIADNKVEFLEGLDKALERSKSGRYILSVKKEAQKNTWLKRAKQINTILNNHE